METERPYITEGQFGIRYLVHPESALDKHIVDSGMLPDWIATRLGELIPPDSVVLDIGANAGLVTLPLARLAVPEGTVHAFEPDFQNASQLQTNVELNRLSNVVVVPAAVQDDPSVETVTLHVRRAIDGDGKTNRGLSSLHRLSVHEVRDEHVLATTIDRYVNENDIGPVRFMKVDVEGAELEVLRGGDATIRRDLPIILYEYSSIIDGLGGGDGSLRSFSHLSSMGYRQYEIDREIRLIALDEPRSEPMDSNVLCIHKSSPVRIPTDWFEAQE
ncbi:MAG: FkbM family methyltransferase [Coriobacteriia bacterium]